MNIMNIYTSIFPIKSHNPSKYIHHTCINIHRHSLSPQIFRGQSGVNIPPRAQKNSRKTTVLRDKLGTWVRNRCKAIQTCAPVKRMLLDQRLIGSMYTLSLKIIVHIFSLNLSTTPKYLKPSYLSSL